MRRLRLVRTPVGWLLAAISIVLSAAPPQAPPTTAEQRAVAYLSLEVPNWPRQNHCFSCHNNGDAARALYVARALSHGVPPDALQETTAWLLDPPAWDDPKGDPGFSDLKLARIQFAAALTEAVQTAAVNDKKALTLAADRLLMDQEHDGSWDVDVPGVVGSPATYGDALGTYMARRTLTASGESRFADAVARTDAWFMSTKPAANVDVCAVALALADRLKGATPFPAPPESSAPLRQKHRGLIERLVANQNSDGGWGPYPKSPSEPFDAAVALLALEAASGLNAIDREAAEKAVARGRNYLISAQLPAGGWIETTRPSGFQSYAQHISTSGWATLALLQTGNQKDANEPR